MLAVETRHKQTPTANLSETQAVSRCEQLRTIALHSSTTGPTYKTRETDQVVALIYLLTAAWLWRMLMIQPRNHLVEEAQSIRSSMASTGFIFL